MEEKLEFLLALAREKHFGRAAHLCGVSQPNLSAAIKQLEAILGVPLVDRGSRFFGFTPEGQRVLEWARRIVGDMRAMRSDIDTMKQGLTGHLRLVVVPTTLPIMARITRAFWKLHPDVKITVSSHSSIEVLSLLDNLEADAGVTYLDNEPVGRVIELPLYRERYHLVTCSEGPLGGRESVTWTEVATQPLCLLSPDMQNRRIINRAFQDIGACVEPILETNSLEVIATHLSMGMWSTVMPRIITEPLHFPPNVRVIPIVDPEVTTSIGMVVPDRDPQPPLTTALINEVRRLAPRLAEMA